MYLFVLVIIYLILSFIDSRLFYHCIALFFLYILLVFLLWQWSPCNWGAVSVCVFWLGIFHFCHFTVRSLGVSVTAILYKFWIDFFSTYSRLNGKRPKFANFAASYHGELQGNAIGQQCSTRKTLNMVHVLNVVVNVSFRMFFYSTTP